ncbi:hypothetical protein E1180_12805 [Roseibium denhamense]|uniref:Uncharacterized protein n=1 Tax=Roseibium denhamense TaxID=76305 RepID=A0ABY1NHA3_9HYPH|nr:hypothetical protein [Roseibium denhamense]MTI06396.1 hypothetical protein [Roseibium denhamense]SMP08852.1 hypothetical protein SAMN06265374_1026 [Roseibium denhamense]
MRSLFLTLAFSTALCAGTPTTWAAPEGAVQNALLVLPAQGLEVDLKSGDVTRKGVTGQCLETVSKAGSNLLVVAKNSGDDKPTVSVDGMIRDLGGPAQEGARLGTIRLARDGSLVHMRTWKTGDKQTELLQESVVRLTFKRGTLAKLLRFTETQALLLVTRPGEPARLIRHKRGAGGLVSKEPEVLLDFAGCVPERVLVRGDVLWARMECADTDTAGIYRIDLTTGSIESPVMTSETADFMTLPRADRPDGEAVLTVSGSPSGINFYYAVNGLLAAQTGEVRACSSDAEGLQSWNQSYRLRALASLFEKTGDSVFAALARKSMRLTLAAQDGVNGRTSNQNPSCGWSSTIYATNNNDRMTLMINQAMIANSLAKACKALGGGCPVELANRIAGTQACLANEYEPDFDPTVGLYRINKDIDFRFKGSIAPWNWQVSMAALLKDLSDPALSARGRSVVKGFYDEWSADENGALFRYWPKAAFEDRDGSPSKRAGERFEDTGHAGISLLSAAEFPDLMTGDHIAALKSREDFLLTFGAATPRDLDGAGPAGPRWFPAGGWSSVPSEAFKKRFSGPVPGVQSADTVFAYANLFDPDADFQLILSIHGCTDVCALHKTYKYDSWQAFFNGNPFFEFRPAALPIASKP